MNNSLKEKIIIPAWELIRTDSGIKKFYFIPGLLSIIFLSAVLSYQTIYTYVKFVSKKEEEVLQVLLSFFETSLGLELIIVGVIIVVLYFLLIPIFEGGLIKYIYLKDKGKDISKSETFGQGLQKFLPIFEYNNMFSEFKLLSILNFYLFTIRFTGLEYISLVNYVFLVVFFLSFFINTIFIYSKYAIVIENQNVFQSIGTSSKLFILNITRTIRLYFLMLVLNFRVILNFLIFLFFPILIALTISLITSTFILYIAVSIISVVFIALILFSGYLTAVLEVFKTALWYYAYKEGKILLQESESDKD